MSRVRALHPGAWWGWALGLSVAASRTTNPFVLLLLLAVAGYVVSARRGDAPWARSFGTFLRLGLVILALRLALQVLLGAPLPGTVLLSLPEIPLPDWAAGVRIGGDVTAPSVTFALYEGLQLATLMGVIGAANALANPTRLLRSLPGALYEAGVAVTVALTFAPQAVESVARVRAARRLRGRPTRGVRGLRGLALPVLEGALERSIELAAAMDSRGYGRRADRSRATRWTTAALTLTGLLGLAVGAYGLLDATGDSGYAAPVLLAGAALSGLGLATGGRRSTRTRYRPDPWGLRESVVLASGLAPAVGLFVATTGLRPSVQPLVWPALPWVAAGLVLLALLPSWVAPAPPTPGPAPLLSEPLAVAA